MNPRSPIHVALVDDHRLFRETLQMFLDREPDIQVVGVFGNGLELLEALPTAHPDVILVDIKMPGLNGLETTRHIMETFPQSRVIVLTVSESDEDLLEAFKVGARGYLLKGTTSGHELAQAIRGVAQGEAIIPPALAPHLLAEFATLARERESIHQRSHTPPRVNVPADEEKTAPVIAQEHETQKEAHADDDALGILTPRERQVLELVAQGLTNKEIAAHLVISENTVRTHLRRILDKLHVHSRVEAAVWLKAHIPQKE